MKSPSGICESLRYLRIIRSLSTWGVWGGLASHHSQPHPPAHPPWLPNLRLPPKVRAWL